MIGRRPVLRWSWILALGLLVSGCAAPTPVVPPLDPLPTRAARAPNDVDLAARDLAEAVLAREFAAAERALARIVELEAQGAGSTLIGHATHAHNAQLEEGPAWRAATRDLLERRDLDPALRADLELAVEEDPLAVARARLAESRNHRIGRRMNALSEPLGRSLISGALLPLRIGQALLGLAVAEHLEDDFSVQQRQALEQWKRFIERNPGSPESAALLERVQRDQQRWYRNQRDRILRSARRAEKEGDHARAAQLASRAQHYVPEDRQATKIRQRAEARLQRQREEHRRSLGAAANVDVGGRALALQLLLPDGAVDREARALLDTGPSEPLASAARFALAGAALRRGSESESWRDLERIAKGASPMARHAGTLYASADQNPHAAWRAARSRARGDRLRFLFFGPLARGARHRDLPRPVEWALEIPTTLQVLTGLPGRLIRLPLWKDKRRSPGVFARRYLERFPTGEQAAGVRRWLQSHEEGRGNWLGALRVAEARDDVTEAERSVLRERAAAQALAATGRERRLDARVALLRRVATEFEGTRAAQHAGLALREEIENATSQQIRLSRGFLLENPQLAGPDGLALRAELLDGRLSNGELHGEGITLLGGRGIEFAYVAGSGDEADPPERIRRSVSEERLTRLVALLQETSLRNALVDPDDAFVPDADRDLFFEQARLGVADGAPAQASARSTYTYLGMRERYGLVRSRESILPVELVVQGSLDDLGLGAFPRIRLPKPTADAPLYR